MKEPFRIEGGFILLPEGLGLGVEMIDDINKVFPFQGDFSRMISFHGDGSVVDR